MSSVLNAALELQKFCRERGWRFCIIGGIAVQRWGEVRQTDDADLTLLTGFGQEESFVDPLLARFAPRMANARAFSLQARVLLLQTELGVPLDIALGGFSFEEHSVARATPWTLGDGNVLITCSAEDLLVHKAFAARARDWLDIEGIVRRWGAGLDYAQMWRELLPLLELKEDPAIEPRLRELIARHTSG